MPLLKTLGSAAGILGNLASIPSQIIQNKQQAKLQQKSFEQNRQMWELSNQYNSPEMQMQRLKAAGLNPNLVYGNGSVVGNTSTQTPKHQAPQIGRIPLETISPLDQLGKFLDLRTKSAQANLAESAAKVKEAEAGWIDKQIVTDLITKMQGNKKLAYQVARRMEWHPSMGRGRIGATESAGNEFSPYMKSFQADVRSKEQNNALRQFELDFFKDFGSKAALNSVLQVLRMLK